MSRSASDPSSASSAVRLAFLPSPLLGPATWAPLVNMLGGRGWSTTVAPVLPGITSAADVQEMFDSALPSGEDLVLVAHSNAGLFIPWLADRHRVAASVFVDAALPLSPGPVALSPPDFYDFLTGMADESGLLPPWTQWWEASEVRELIPDSQMRDALTRQTQRLPLSYFRETVPVPTGWHQKPCAYVAFGDTYAEEKRFAAHSGWPVRTLPGRHLHMVVDPEEVAANITELLAVLGNSG